MTSWRAAGLDDGERLAARVAGLLGAVAAPSIDVRRFWLDTFDGRLWRDGVTLALEADRAEALVRLWRAGRSDLVEPIEDVPRWPTDLPEGRLRDVVAKAHHGRALVPLVEERVRRWRLSVHDARGEVVLRVEVEHATVPEAVRGRRDLGVRARVCPRDGHDEAAARAVVALEGAGFEQVASTALEEALAALGRRPAEVEPRPDLALDPAVRADVAVTLVLAHLRDVIVANEAGVVADLDPEFLHDLRVAVRRTRSLLATSDAILPPRKVERFAERFRWAQRVTGELRDLDVQLAALPSHRAALEPDVAAALAPLDTWLRERREEARRRTARALSSRRWRKLFATWGELLDTPVDARPKLERATRPIGDVAREQVKRLLRRVLKQGRRLDADAPASALHALRKRCKKLRYVLEAWRSVLDRDAADRVIKDLKALQRLLGTFQDQEVHAAALAALAAEKMAAKRAPTETVLAIGALVDRLRAAQVQTRASFERTFAAFDSDKVAAHVAALLARPE